MSTKKPTEKETLINKKNVPVLIIGIVIGILVVILFIVMDYYMYLNSCLNDPCGNNGDVLCIKPCEHKSILFGEGRPFDPTPEFKYF